MGKQLIGFDRELEIRIFDSIRPFLCDLGLKLPIEGSVDFARVEVVGEKVSSGVEPPTSRFTERGYTMPLQSG
jgi:hypothetical protein